MTYLNLADFLETLRQAGELILVDVEVDPCAAGETLLPHVSRSGASVLFGKVRGHDIPLLVHLLGSERRICRAIGIESVGDLSRRVADLLELQEPENWRQRLSLSLSAGALGRLVPKLVKTGDCQQVVKLGGDIDLGELPAVSFGIQQPARAITAAQVFSRDAASGQTVVGRYDLVVLDRQRLACGWLEPDEPARLLSDYRQREQQMPLAAVLGGDPAGLLAAMAPLPPRVDVSAVAGLLRGKAREMVRCRTVDLEVPADAEIVIEGYIDPSEPLEQTGPLLGPGAYRQRSRPAAVMHVTAMTHRANPVFPAMLPGPAPDEACTVRRFLHRAFLPLVRAAVPGLIDLDLPMFGAARHWVLASIRKRYAGQAWQVAAALWSQPVARFAKMLVIVDEGVDVNDPTQVWSAMTAHVDPGHDVVIQPGPADPLDPAAPADGLSRRMAIDATAKLPGERRTARGQP